MVSRSQEYILAKTITYALNAGDDVRISKLIQRYVKNGRLPSDKRARIFIEFSNKDPQPKQFLSGICYSLDRINGLVDIVYARLFAKYILSQKYKKVAMPFLLDPAYSEYHPWYLITTWKKIILNDMSDVVNYLNHPVDTQSIKRAVAAAQKENIILNKKIALLLITGSSTTNNKVLILRKVAKTMNYPKLFLQAAANTERAAARWDRALLFLLHR